MAAATRVGPPRHAQARVPAPAAATLSRWPRARRTTSSHGADAGWLGRGGGWRARACQPRPPPRGAAGRGLDERTPHTARRRAVRFGAGAWRAGAGGAGSRGGAPGRDGPARPAPPAPDRTPRGPLHFIMAPLAILSRWQQQVSQARAREQLGNRIIRCDVRYPDVGYNPISGYPTSYAISVYPDIVPDIGYLFRYPISGKTRYQSIPDIGKSPISGCTRYREIPDIGETPISGNPRYRGVPDIGYLEKRYPISGTISGYTDIAYFVRDIGYCQGSR